MPLYIEIWNEPDLEVEWSKQPNAAEYGAFLSAVYAGIKELNKPQIKVLNAGLSPLQAMAQADAAHMQSFDVLASHSYPYNLPPELNNHNAQAENGEEFASTIISKSCQFYVILAATSYP